MGVCLVSRATVERVPSTPDERGPKHGKWNVVVRELGIVSRLTPLEARGDDERGDATRSVDREAAGKVEDAEVCEPALWVPNPMREWVVDEEGPNRDEDEECVELELFSPRSRDDWGRGRREEVGETEHKQT